MHGTTVKKAYSFTFAPEIHKYVSSPQLRSCQYSRFANSSN